MNALKELSEGVQATTAWYPTTSGDYDELSVGSALTSAKAVRPPLCTYFSGTGEIEAASSTFIVFGVFEDTIADTYAQPRQRAFGPAHIIRDGAHLCGGHRWEDIRPYWVRVAELNSDSLPVERLQELVVELSVMLSNGQYRKVDEGLASASIAAVSQDAMVAILRTTYAARHNLNRWFDFLDRCEAVLKRTNRNSASISRLRVVASR